MSTGNDARSRNRWLSEYHRIGHAIAVIPGVVIAYLVGLASEDFSFVTLLVLVLGIEAIAFGASWLLSRSDQNR